jgi:lipopolysaccharide transport system ATP-binding protein
MEDVRQHGRTILFVSHNMQAITRLCERALLISQGGITHDGPAAETAGKYLMSSIKTDAERTWPEAHGAPGNDVARLRSVRVRDKAGDTIDSIDIRKEVGVEMVFEVLQDGHTLIPAMEFHDESGTCLFVTQDLEPRWRGKPRPRGTVTTVAWVPGNLLSEGLLLASVWLSTPRPLKSHFVVRDVVAFHVVDSFEPDSARGDWDGPIPGVVRALLTWTTETSGPLSAP